MVAGIVLAMLVGLAIGVTTLWLLLRGRGPFRWRQAGISALVAVVATFGGLVLSVLTFPDGGPQPPEGLTTVLGMVLFPGSALMGLLGSWSGLVPFFGGFVLSALLWLLISYFVLSRLRGARA